MGGGQLLLFSGGIFEDFSAFLGEGILNADLLKLLGPPIMLLPIII
jgi:hypothetical protein